MAQLSYSEQALADIDRLVMFLLELDINQATRTATLITQAVSILQDHPLIGRPVEHGLRELVISRGRTGYIALYSFEEDTDVVLILALRHQRETGYQVQN